LSDWGNKSLELLDFSRLDASHHTRQDWLIQHLTHPPAASAADVLDEPRMPFFHLSLVQAQALAVFVMGNRQVADRPAEVNEALAKGRGLTLLHNCVGCHQTETNTPAIQQYFSPGAVSSLAPPPLRGEGSKVQSQWLTSFLAHVTPLRPLPAVRMPSFNFDVTPGHEEITALASYFPAAAVHEGGELRRWLSAGDGPALEDWAMLHGQAAAADLDPAFNTPRQLAQARLDIEFKARFTAHLYDLAVTQPVSAISPADFARGERFVQTLQCLDCHVLAAEGRSVDMSHARAPNLELAWRRLRPAWVRAWIQEPDIVLHGTNMPAYFTGLPKSDLGGRPLADAERLSLEQAAAVAIFGQTVQEQTKLVIDFLYAAGERGYTTVRRPEMNVLTAKAAR
jgi:mono/diheme cytochrome c family protein